MLSGFVAPLVAALSLWGPFTSPPQKSTRTELVFEYRVDRLERKVLRQKRLKMRWRREAHRRPKKITRTVCCDTIVSLGKRLQALRFRVSEHPAFGGVAPVHFGRAHYQGLALDVNASAGASEYERVRFRWLVPQLRSLPCVGLILYPDNDPSHDDHLHLEWAC